MSAPLRLVVVGDALLDRDVHGGAQRLSPEAPVPVLDETGSEARPGGAALAAALAARDGWPVTLVCALGDDDAGRELAGLLERVGVEVVDLGLEGSTPEKIRFLAGERPLLRLDRGGDPGRVGAPGAAARAAIAWADAVLVADYGRGITSEPDVRRALAEVANRAPIVWDPHPRGAPPIANVDVATPNESELEHFAGGLRAGEGIGLTSATERVVGDAESLRRAWGARAVCLTRGACGALVLSRGGGPLVLPSVPAAGGDTCGAGDRFASRLACALARGRSLADAALEAVAAASAFVAAGGARRALASDEDRSAAAAGDGDAITIARAARAAGGTLVATGGCFDLLHAGHVGMLEAARNLGDCLVVCLNSDASVRRLKGGKRPLVPQGDRAAVLAALACVDGVVIFDEDTPERVLEELQPDIWVKGGDYENVALPEQRALTEMGASTFILPHLGGRSTTRLIEEAAELA